MHYMMNLKVSSFAVSLWFFLANCYFNPIVNGFVNPVEEENQTVSFLGIAAVLAGAKVQITGQVLKADGSAVTNGSLTILSRTNASSDLPSTFSLNEAGRFFLTLSLGETKIQVEQSGSILFTFTIYVPNPGVASISETSIADVRVIGLEFYSSQADVSYFDIINFSPADNTTATFWPTYINVSFSENVELSTGLQTFLDANVITNPTITLDGSNSDLTNNFLQIRNNSNFGIGTNIYTFKSDIKSVSGKRLAPRIFTYICNSPCSGL